jgi:hypothetical protein
MNTPMTPEQLEREMQRQATAELRERIGSHEHDDPSIDQYRLISRIVKQASIPALPANFAARVAQQAGDYEERAQFESSALTVILIVAIIAGLFLALPPLIDAWRNFTVSIDLPWPMLLAVLFALGFAAMIDKLSSQHRLTRT